MKMPALRTSTVVLEESWRLKVEEARRRYLTTCEDHRRVLGEQSAALPRSPNGAVTRAHQAEFEALTEYMRVLQIFSDLTLRHKIPEGESAGTSNGAGH